MASFSRGGTGCSIIDQFPSAIFYQPLFPSRDFMRLYWLFIKRYGVLFFSMPECCSFSSVLFRFFFSTTPVAFGRKLSFESDATLTRKSNPPPSKKKARKAKDNLRGQGPTRRHHCPATTTRNAFPARPLCGRFFFGVTLSRWRR